MRALAAALVIAALPPSVHPWPIGGGPQYRPDAPVRDGRPVAGMRCGSAPARFVVHVELFAHRRVVVLPRGIGRGPGCAYPLRTLEPTGVVFAARTATLGDLFRVWGRQLGRQRLLSFRGAVRVFAGGHRVAGDPRAVRLLPRRQIVVELGGYVPPHPSYLFPKGTP
jgi:hypothetical protein